jgi:hypothetical protein
MVEQMLIVIPSASIAATRSVIYSAKCSINIRMFGFAAAEI